MSLQQNLDELDMGIIRLLAGDGRMPFSEMATQLGVTEKTIRSRYNNLRENKILAVVGVVNPISLGIHVEAIIQLLVEPEKIDLVIAEAAEHKEIRYITLTTGDYQMLVQIHVRTMDELNHFYKEKLCKINGIVKTNLLYQLDIYKNTFEYFMKEDPK